MEETMGIVNAEITLKNAGDVGRADDGVIKEEAIRQRTVNALVDTGAGTLVINGELCRQLGLKIKGLRRAAFANDTRETCKVTEPVYVHWKDRSMSCQALVVEKSGEVLLGSIPLEDMDLMVDPVRRELTGAHGDEVVCLVK
jgi:clan AA aspartic protease